MSIVRVVVGLLVVTAIMAVIYSAFLAEPAPSPTLPSPSAQHGLEALTG